jgi:drug/metabolite transporter (DMT)-like permease
MEKQRMVLGILVGLLAAFFQSLSYLCSRVFIQKHNNDVVKLLALSHIIMGVISIPLALILLPKNMPEFSSYVFSLLGSAVFYLLGQLFLFIAIIKFEPSRVSPLLGLKVLILAIISVVFFRDHFSLAKWFAVILSTISIFLLSNSGKRLEWKCIVLALLACLAYCLSDLSISVLVGKFSFLGVFRGASLSSAFCYILCGIFGLITLFFTPKNTSRDTWVYALPFAASWFLAMIFLYSCFGLVGVVFGNIIQSTRGIISILLGAFIAHIGFEALEAKMTKAMLIQRILAAILMTGSVALFLL